MKPISSRIKSILFSFFLASLLLLSGQAKATCNFHAGFTATASTSNCNEYIFSNTSYVTNSNDSGVSYLWVLGTSIFSTTKNSSYLFSANGTYTVCLVMFKQTSAGICADTMCQTITVNCTSGTSCSWGSLGWEWTKNCTNKNLYFKAFNSDSLGTYKYTWGFGDATYDTLNHQVTYHSYGAVNQYTACLNIKKYNNGVVCKDTTICKTVTVSTPLKDVDFSFTASTANCKEVSFSIIDSNNMTNAACAYYRWYWGDGTSTLQTSKTTPIGHLFAGNGTYTVCVKALSCNDTNCYTIKCKSVTINCATGCNFGTVSWGWGYNCTTRTVTFSGYCSDTTGGIRYTWAFGDQTYDTLNHRVTSHVYANNGTYTACFNVKKYFNGVVCKDTTICKTITVTSCTNTCLLYGGWSYSVACPTKVVSFQGYVGDTTGIYSYTWNYGDNSVAGTTKSATHTYANNGTYNVCLSIKRYTSSNTSTPCHDTTICKQVVVNCTSSTSCSLYGNWTYSLSCPSKTVSFLSYVGDTNGIYAYIWNFGDSSSATTKNATHTFVNNGTYTVCLKIKRYVPGTTTVCKDTNICKTVSVNCNSTCSLYGGWSYSVSCPSRAVHFSSFVADTSAYYTYLWTFGDNTTAYTKDPLHTYTSNGNYTVCLTIKRFASNSNIVCRDTVICKSIAINCNTPCSLLAGWSYNVSCPSRTVSFNTSIADTTGYYGYIWSFGDSTSATTTSRNLTHTFYHNGTFNVCLTVKRYSTSGGATVVCRDTTICKTVTVSCTTCSMLANYTYGVNCANKKLEVLNTSTGDSCFISKWAWGDGTYSNDKNPSSHTYTQAGTYTVCLIVKKCSDTTCVNYICKSIVIPVNCCNSHANFGATVNCPNKKVEVVNYSYGDSCMNYTWFWGDNSYTTTKNPGSHTYTAAGTYTICLKVVKCNDSTCYNYYCKTIVIPTVCCPVANFYSYNFCNTFRFVNTTVGGTSYWWSFGDSSFSSAKSPYHTFFSKRTFQVCLTVFDSVKHCSTTVCKNVLVNCGWFGGGNHFEVPLSDGNIGDVAKTAQNTDLTPSKGLQMNVQAGITAYPNPTNSILNVILPATTSTVKITDMTGALLMQFDNVISFCKADVSRLAAGVYFVNVVNENGTQSVRFMKN